MNKQLSFDFGKQQKLDFEAYNSKENGNVPFVNEVETFNATFGKPNNYEPTIPEEKEWKFVYNFILEELEEYREACERGDIVLHGLKDKIWPAYQEVQASNMSKACKSKKEALDTVRVRSEEQNTPCHFEKLEKGRYIVYRTADKKVMKSINYFKPNLKQFFDEKEIEKCLPNADPITII